MCGPRTGVRQLHSTEPDVRELNRQRQQLQAPPGPDLDDRLRLEPFDGACKPQLEDALVTATRMEPDNGFIYVLRGDRYSIEGKIPEARAQYEKALEVDEHRVGALVRPALAKLGGAAKVSTGGANEKK